MKDSRFLSADIDPARDTNVNNLKEQALQLIHQELTEDRKLHDDAAVAILNDYDGMGAETFLKQLHTYSLILNALKNKVAFHKMVNLLANILRAGIYKVDGEALDAVTVRRDAIQVHVDGKSTMIGTVNSELLTILSLGKESRETERQLMVIDRLVKRRNDENLQAVSHAFKIPLHDTEKITLLIEKLFDGQGNFIRKDIRADDR